MSELYTFSPEEYAEAAGVWSDDEVARPGHPPGPLEVVEGFPRGHLEKSFPDAAGVRFATVLGIGAWADGPGGFFDLSRRYGGLDRKRDPLVTLAAVIPWETFRPMLLQALVAQDLRTPADGRRSQAGRKPWDEVVIFKTLVLQALYNLSDEQTEYQPRGARATG